jgi:ATP-dependent DNA helicase RecQ
MIRQYAGTDECRRAFILNYFGEASSPTCGNCDNCEAGLVTPAHQGREPFPTGAGVTHVRWGTGQVVRYEDDTITILFESVGYRTLALDLVQEEGLLTAAS